MQTILDKQKNFLIKKFHILVGLAGIDNDSKRDILSQYEAASSKDLTAHQLLDLCSKLEKLIYPDAKKMDMWRKRLIAAIDAWLLAMSKERNLNIIKAIAVRAAGECKSFNAIPLERLRSLYYAFVKKTKDIKTVERMTKEEIDYSTFQN